MSKFHSTVSRRTFMKGLGLAGAGLGAAAATAPVFHDLDEVMAAPQAARKLPWWIKERDVNDPTVEIDWPNKERYDRRGRPVVANEDKEGRIQTQLDFIKSEWTEPGMTHRDYAFMAGCGPRISTDLNTGISRLHYTNGGTTQPGGYTYEDLGLPRWSASPEENLRMVTAALHFWGAGQVGCIEVDEKSKKTFYGLDTKGKPYVWDDVEEAYSDADHAMVIPNSAKYILTWVVPMAGSGKYTYPTGTNIMGKTSMNIGYSHGSIISARIGTMVGSLGYKSISSSCGGINVAIGTLAGTGEFGRTGYLVSPEYGTNLRYSQFLLTDLPIAITKPIDAGIWSFCKVCKKCASTCPAGAILEDDEPSFEIVYPGSQVYGLKCYHQDYPKCLPYRGSPGGIRPGGCGICQNVCVFNKTADALIHSATKGLVSVTSVFNTFLRTLDDQFSYGEFRKTEEFWDVMVDTQGSFVPWPYAKSNISGGL